MARRYRKKNTLKAEMNVVPYIDVMLVLLVIFMVATPLMQSQAIEVDLPPSSIAQEEESEETPEVPVLPLILSVDAAGQYYLNQGANAGEPMSSADIQAFTQSALAENPTLPVLIEGDKSVPYEQIVAGIVLLQQAGVAKVGLVTEASDTAERE